MSTYTPLDIGDNSSPQSRKIKWKEYEFVNLLLHITNQNLIVQSNIIDKDKSILFECFYSLK